MVSFFLLVPVLLFLAWIVFGFEILSRLCKKLKNPEREVGFNMTLADFFLVSFLISMSILFGSAFGDEIAGMFSENEAAQVFISMGVLHYLVVCSVFFFLKKSDSKPRLFLGKSAGFFKIALGSAGFFFGLVSLIVLVSFVWNLVLLWYGMEIKPQEVVEYFRDVGGYMKLFALFSVVLLAPLSEELVFRGVMYGGLKKKIGAGFAALIVSVLFAAIHFSLPAFMPIFFLSLLLIAVYEYYGDLRASMVVHSLFNSMTSFLMLAEEHLIDV